MSHNHYGHCKSYRCVILCLDRCVIHHYTEHMDARHYDPAALRAARERARMSQTQAATAIGKTLKTVQRIERGEKTRVDTLEALAAAYSISLRSVLRPEFGAAPSFASK